MKKSWSNDGRNGEVCGDDVYVLQAAERAPAQKEEEMRVIRVENYAQMSEKAADFVAAQLLLKPDSVLGLATGSTPEGMYQSLIRRVQAGEISFAQARSVNLDEYVGLSPEDPQSYHAYMKKHLFSQVDIRMENTSVPDGLDRDPKKACARYEAKIRAMGGIDLQVLGIGRNAHIGFNEPGESFPAVTHVTDLAESTIEANSRFFERKEEVPTQAMTMGIGTIFTARRIVLLVSGQDKAQALRDALLGPVTPAVPASILQFHPQVIVIADEEACSLIREIPVR